MKVRHPVFSDVVRDVQDPDRWVAVGWVLIDPDPVKRPKPRPRRRR